MINRKDYVYATTKLTNDGLQTLLFDNINFEIAGYTFIDDEVTYNLFNSDQKITKGFDRVNYFEDDSIEDILSLSINDPTYRIDGDLINFLFGDPTRHALTPDKIKTESDSIKDMVGVSIQAVNEIPAARNARRFDFTNTILSGNFPDFILDNTQLLTWAVVIDIRGTITIYTDSTSQVFAEEDGVFSKLTYTVRFHGDSVDKIFQLDIDVTPGQPLQLSTDDFKKRLGIDYDLYGTFYIFKTFTYGNNTQYTSSTITFKTLQPAQTNDKATLDGRDSVLKSLSLPSISKTIFTNVPTDSISGDAKFYGNYISDRVINQTGLTKYIILDNPVKLTFRSSTISNFHLQLQNLSTGKKLPILSLEGDMVDNVNFLTLPVMDLNVLFYKQALADGYYLMIRAMPLADSGYLVPEPFDFSSGSLKYSLFGEKKYNLSITYLTKIFLGDLVSFPSKSGIDTLWYLYSTDNNIIYNSDSAQFKMMDNYESLIFDVK